MSHMFYDSSEPPSAPREVPRSGSNIREPLRFRHAARWLYYLACFLTFVLLGGLLCLIGGR